MLTLNVSFVWRRRRAVSVRMVPLSVRGRHAVAEGQVVLSEVHRIDETARRPQVSENVDDDGDVDDCRARIGMPMEFKNRNCNKPKNSTHMLDETAVWHFKLSTFT